MATVNFSVPDAVKTEFDRTFKGRNKSAVIAALMRRAVEETRQQERRETLFRLLTERRTRRPSASDARIRQARNAGRA